MVEAQGFLVTDEGTFDERQLLSYVVGKHNIQTILWKPRGGVLVACGMRIMG